VRCGTGFDANKARRKLLEERQHMRPPKLFANDGVARRIDTVNLKD
jgi:hypothetical protein